MYSIIKGKEGVIFCNGTVLNENASQEQLAEIFEWQKDELVKFVVDSTSLTNQVPASASKEKKVLVSD